MELSALEGRQLSSCLWLPSSPLTSLAGLPSKEKWTAAVRAHASWEGSQVRAPAEEGLCTSQTSEPSSKPLCPAVLATDRASLLAAANPPLTGRPSPGRTPHTRRPLESHPCLVAAVGLRPGSHHLLEESQGPGSPAGPWEFPLTSYSVTGFLLGLPSTLKTFSN